VAGCATGEEAYSLAILVHEQLAALRRPITAKIFATDVHRASLDFASIGLYPDASLAELSPQRRERYFVRKKGGYQVAQHLRQMVVFAPHNVTRDAPFRQLDLISCRNLLIYLRPAAQQKVLSLFHFGLKTGGVLLLEPSENAGKLADEYETLDERWRIYRKHRDIRLLPELRVPMEGAPRHSELGGFRAGPQALPVGDHPRLRRPARLLHAPQPAHQRAA
jgi:two-component system, chemotaxis family, CheB/CheR fusion protein